MQILFSTFFLLLAFLAGLLCFILNQYHALSLLLALEIIALRVYAILSLVTILPKSISYTSLYYLAIAVCESALGLRIIVLFTRAKGSEMLDNKITLL